MLSILLHFEDCPGVFYGLAQAMYADEVSQQQPKSYLGMERFILLLNNNSAV